MTRVSVEISSIFSSLSSLKCEKAGITFFASSVILLCKIPRSMKWRHLSIFSWVFNRINWHYYSIFHKSRSYKKIYQFSDQKIHHKTNKLIGLLIIHTERFFDLASVTGTHEGNRFSVRSKYSSGMLKSET